MTKIQNVLLIVVDTLRARNVGAYGSSYDTTPSIDSVAATNTIFDHAVCTQSGSWISYTTLFRGDHVFSFPLRNSSEHHRRVNVNNQYKLAFANTPPEKTVPGILQQNGVFTAATVSGEMLDRTWGWHKNFDRYDDDYDGRLQKIAMQNRSTALLYRAASHFNKSYFPPFGSRRGELTAESALQQLDDLEDDRPWMFFLQFTDPHEPLVPYRDAPDSWPCYDQEIRRADDAISRVLMKLEESGQREDTLIIITGDHGESLGEHDMPHGHGKNVYEESMRVPLILAHPSLPDRRITDGVARIKDLAPTICEALDAPIPESFHSQSLLPVAKGNTKPPTDALIFANGSHMISQKKGREVPSSEAGTVVGLRTPTEKYVIAPAHSEPKWYYNLDTDPHETRNLIGERDTSQISKLLEERIDEWDRRAPDMDAGEQWSPSHNIKEQLQDLGYI